MGSRPHMKAAATTGISPRWVSVFCIVSFCFGVLLINRLWAIPDSIKMDASSMEKQQLREPQPVVNCEKKEVSIQEGDIISQVSQTHDIIMTLDKTISSLEMQLAAARAARADDEEESHTASKAGTEQPKQRPKVFFVMGIITAFSNRKRRDSIRETWMPKGEELNKLEREKGIIIRFVIGHSATPGGVLDRIIDAENVQHKDFLRLNHVEGYHELSTKTQIYFSTAVAKWDADFYIKVDDDVHINLGMVGSTLARHRSKPRVYIGCMKSGPVLAQKGVKYHEPEYWKFGEEGNKYFRHATGQIYAVSKDLATYISVNRHILHRFANEDVSLGSWFIGLDVEHIDDRSLCCGTPPDCEWKAQAGNPCGASFDWSCSGVCKSVERMEEVHQRCGEGDGAIWHTSF
ncbi:beta-1,6-galactosyltransferase GALT31A [Malania oleifera]|uniref:beta-1,6-galactosyltransferase GALT31A n=1 Tax=Malania oleifera TaxID=397392 RepID=UPI0025ADB575|nr:beta-1,6-galactosyltransferase GALT31A [Malania oleifera]XP_057969686.1 beta-1,6-galactosyltransferase GALT31A [Malania oleifera]XP_057969687.1 beta-1,6-galactosyltransferase GALT31A [Malania oleifera]XP_057969688.1 beta-1,6-galactosyltransferase GALT31A [Malania oleifera]XP_057969689.1 beta-1,6-galactosyltransferase GALT31A [Malania oleifera]